MTEEQEPLLIAHLWDHIIALRQTFLQVFATVCIGFVVSLFFYKQLLFLVALPAAQDGVAVSLTLLSPTEGIVSAFSCSFWAGVVLTSPVWLFFVLRFVAPALKYHEKILIVPFACLSLFFFAAGLLFAYTITLPIAIHYLQLFNADLGVNLWSLSLYLDFTLLLLFANGLAFEAIVILLFLVHFGLVTPSFLARRRREAIVAILFISALLTPPDVITQILLAVPLTLLYELSIFYGKLRLRQKRLSLRP